MISPKYICAAWLAIEGDAGELETVLKIETDLALDISDSRYEKGRVTDLLLATQQYLIDNPEIGRFTLVEAGSEKRRPLERKPAEVVEIVSERYRPATMRKSVTNQTSVQKPRSH